MLSTLRAAIDRAKHTWRSRASGSPGISGCSARPSTPAVLSIAPLAAQDPELMCALTIRTLSIKALTKQAPDGARRSDAVEHEGGELVVGVRVAEPGGREDRAALDTRHGGGGRVGDESGGHGGE